MLKASQNMSSLSLRKLFEMSMLPYVQQCHWTVYFWFHLLYVASAKTHTSTHVHTHNHTYKSTEIPTSHCAQSHSQSLHAYWMTSVYIWSPTTELRVALTKVMSSFSVFNVLFWGGKGWECFNFKHGFLELSYMEAYCILTGKNLMFCHNRSTFFLALYWDFFLLFGNRFFLCCNKIISQY